MSRAPAHTLRECVGHVGRHEWSSGLAFGAIPPGGASVTRISEWYVSLGEYSFPTTFLRLSDGEVAALCSGEGDSADGRRTAARLQAAIRHLTGSCFVGADVCAPTDSPRYRPGRWVTFGKSAWKLLATSEKVRGALAAGSTSLLTVRPFRRMDRAREFRLFFQHRRLVGISQYCLERHFARVVKREPEIRRLAVRLAGSISDRLPTEDQAVDVYLTSSNRFILVDLNPWGDPTSPLLFKTWDRDWQPEDEIRLIPRPVRMKGDVSVSF